MVWVIAVGTVSRDGQHSPRRQFNGTTVVGEGTGRHGPGAIDLGPVPEPGPSGADIHVLVENDNGSLCATLRDFLHPVLAFVVTGALRFVGGVGLNNAACYELGSVPVTGQPGEVRGYLPVQQSGGIRSINRQVAVRNVAYPYLPGVGT